MTYSRRNDTTLMTTLNRWVDRDLAGYAARYGTDAAVVYGLNRGRPGVAATLEAFGTQVQNGAPFLLPIRNAERSQEWKRVPPSDRSLELICAEENTARARDHLPGVSPVFIWNLSTNAAFRAGAMTNVANTARNREAFPDSASCAAEAVFIPRDLGPVQQALRAQPNGNITLDTPGDWMVRIRTKLERLELSFDPLERYRDQIIERQRECAQEATYSTLVRRFIDLLQENRNSPELAGLVAAIHQLDVQVARNLAMNPLRHEYPELLTLRDEFAGHFVDVLHRDAQFKSDIQELERQRSTVLRGGETWEWYNRVSTRATQLTHDLPLAQDLMDKVCAAVVGHSSDHTESAIVWTAQQFAATTPLFVGNAPGPANLYVSFLQYATYRELVKTVSGRGGLPGAVPVLRQGLANSIRRLSGPEMRQVEELLVRGGRSNMQLATQVIIGGTESRRRMEQAARIITGDIQTGPLASSICIVCAGLSMLMTASTTQRFTPEFVAQLLGGQATMASSYAQLLLKWLSSSSRAELELLGHFGELAGRAAAVLGIVASCLGYADYLHDTPTGRMDAWKVASYVLSIASGGFTLVSYLVVIPGGQLIGGALMLAAIITAIVADGEKLREWLQGPAARFLRWVLQYLGERPHFLAISRVVPDLAAAYQTALLRIADLSGGFVVGNDGYDYGTRLFAPSSSSSVLRRKLRELGLDEGQVRDLVQPSSPLPAPRAG